MKAPRAEPVVPRLTPMWGDIPVTRLHIPPRPEAVVSCGRDESLCVSSSPYLLILELME
jgi:hypothetical protein